jgi:endonuclease YncB( thermonuclease family)
MIALAIALYISTPYAIDGDTIDVKGERVRLVQVNTPEIGTCYAEEARRFTQSFLKSEGEVMLMQDPSLDNKDNYGRSLRYVIKGNRNLNLELVRGGYAKPLFFNKVKGKYGKEIEQYARSAKANRLGVWNCKTGETK